MGQSRAIQFGRIRTIDWITRKQMMFSLSLLQTYIEKSSQFKLEYGKYIHIFFSHQIEHRSSGTGGLSHTSQQRAGGETTQGCIPRGRWKLPEVLPHPVGRCGHQMAQGQLGNLLQVVSVSQCRERDHTI